MSSKKKMYHDYFCKKHVREILEKEITTFCKTCNANAIKMQTISKIQELLIQIKQC